MARILVLSRNCKVGRLDLAGNFREHCQNNEKRLRKAALFHKKALVLGIGVAKIPILRKFMFHLPPSVKFFGLDSEWSK